MSKTEKKLNIPLLKEKSKNSIRKETKFLFEYNKENKDKKKKDFIIIGKKENNIVSHIKRLKKKGKTVSLMFDVDQTLVRHNKLEMAMAIYKSIMETLKRDEKTSKYITEIPNNTRLFINLSNPGIFYRMDEDTFFIADDKNMIIKALRGINLEERRDIREKYLRKDFYKKSKYYHSLETPINTGIAIAYTTFSNLYITHKRKIQNSTQEEQKALNIEASARVSNTLEKIFGDWEGSLFYKKIRKNTKKYIKTYDNSIRGLSTLIQASDHSIIVSNAQDDFLRFEMEYVYGKSILFLFDDIISMASKPKWFKSTEFKRLAKGKHVFYIGDSLLSDIAGAKDSRNENVSIIGVFNYILNMERRDVLINEIEYDEKTLWTLGEEKETLVSFIYNSLVVEKMKICEWICLKDDWILNCDLIFLNKNKKRKRKKNL